MVPHHSIHAYRQYCGTTFNFVLARHTLLLLFNLHTSACGVRLPKLDDYWDDNNRDLLCVERVSRYCCHRHTQATVTVTQRSAKYRALRHTIYLLHSPHECENTELSIGFYTASVNSVTFLSACMTSLSITFDIRSGSSSFSTWRAWDVCFADIIMTATTWPSQRLQFWRSTVDLIVISQPVVNTNHLAQYLRRMTRVPRSAAHSPEDNQLQVSWQDLLTECRRIVSNFQLRKDWLLTDVTSTQLYIGTFTRISNGDAPQFTNFRASACCRIFQQHYWRHGSRSSL